MSEIFGKTWEFFGKLSEIFFRTWEIFSHKWESPKNRPQRNGFAKPLARVTRARITGIFIFLLSQPSHERWFLPRNRLKMFPKRKRLHKKTHPLFCREMVKVVKAKNQICRGRRAWRVHARNWCSFFSSDEQEKKERSIKVFLENSCHHAARSCEMWKVEAHPWCNEWMFWVEVWQQTNPKEGKRRGEWRRIRLNHCDFWNVKGLMVFFLFENLCFLLALIQT